MALQSLVTIDICILFREVIKVLAQEANRIWGKKPPHHCSHKTTTKNMKTDTVSASPAEVQEREAEVDWGGGGGGGGSVWKRVVGGGGGASR